MKRNNIYLLITLLSILLSCNSDEKVNGNGFVRIGIITNTSVITKAEGDVEIKNIRLVISNVTENSSDKDWSKEYNFAPDAPSEDIELAPGNYKLVAIASNGSEVADGFTPAYMGEAMVEVTAGNTSTAWIECKLTTVKVLVEYASSVVGTYQTEYKTVVGGVAFSGEEKRAGYIAPGNLSVDFMFKDNAGSWQTISLDKIAEAKAQEYYKIKISMKSTEGEGDGSSEGAANITIQIGKENPKDIEIGIVLPKVVVTTLEAENVEYTTATLKGSYLSSSGTVPSVNKQMFYYRKTSESPWTTIQAQGKRSAEFNYQASLEGLVASTTYEYKFMEKGETKEFTTKTPDITLDKNYRGVTTAVVYGELAEANKNSTLTPFFKYRKGSSGDWSQPVNAILVTEGDYRYKALLEGLDANTIYEYKFMEFTEESKSFTTLQSIQVLKAVTGADYATITCDIPGIKVGDAILLNLKEYDEATWAYVRKEHDVVNSDIVNDQFVCKFGNLTQDATYYIDDETKSFTTLYNADFDNWYTVGKSVYTGVESEGTNSFWDTGNPGAATLSKNPTDKESSDVHTTGGNAVKMVSQYVGVEFLGLGKFAAGNIYIGHYCDTYTSGGYGARIRFGRPFGSRPTQLKGWYKYTRGTNVKYGSDPYKQELKNSGGDQCAIYIALTNNMGLDGDFGKTAFEIDNHGSDDPGSFKYKSTIDFSENNKNIIAYGSISAEEMKGSFDSDGKTVIWKPITIDLDYRDLASEPKYIMVVASASKYGDFFAGAANSTMFIDDFELVYDYTKPPYTN